MANHSIYSDIQKNRLSIVKTEEILKCKGYENLNSEQAMIVAESLRLFCEIIADMYFLTGRI
ncbi:hypothetical protein CLV24_12028 [Pontibacter ummariensis]|uniref:Uncharacterized protein n=1 Tax=Pontibacter ummariensis TaxID=1610492 RepID=A0A239J3J8_9BACT|nr:hypothetical protein [Pontibacter ummariensis]PRY08864.1 hypothetical protein CLV24_12028 [Pontibacter ummariensis]SNT00380.1 hypothetical protein SAMN06296052_12027 [Pontibacter ummariensis]